MHSRYGWNADFSAIMDLHQRSQTMKISIFEPKQPRALFIILVGICLSLTGCIDPASKPLIAINNVPFELNADTVYIAEHIWDDKLGTYPFTSDSYLACALDRVQFYPGDFTEESVPLPLNKLAEEDWKAEGGVDHLPQNVIRPNANLDVTIKLGLEICKANKTGLKDI